MVQARNRKGKRVAGQKTFFLHSELLEGSKYYNKGGGELARIVRMGLCQLRRSWIEMLRDYN